MNGIFTASVYRKDSFDVVICGSGPAGFAAAVQASREGLRVALLEQDGCFGGNMTSGGVCHLLGGRRWDASTRHMVRETGGFFDELTDTLIASGKAVDPDKIDAEHNNPFGWYPRMAAGVACDLEALKLQLDRIVRAEKIKPFLFTTAIGVEKENGRITALYASDRQGIRSFTAETFVDASGDAQIAYLADCPFFKGRDEDHLMTPATLIAHIDNVDMEEYVAYQNAHQSPKLIEIISDLREKGIWTFPFEIFISIELNNADVCMLNTVRQVGVDGTDAASLTNGMIEGRETTDALLTIMRQYFPGFQNARLRTTFSRIGIRESRRIDGRAYVTLQDAETGKEYPDQVIRTTYNFDLPDPKRPSFDPMLGSVENPNTVRKYIGITAPYGCLLPKGIDNLVVCGRCISVSREILGPMRVTGPAMLGGQAAGFAASIAHREKISVAEVDGKTIREKMKCVGCII